MRFLFVKRELMWPRASGHDVHSYSMMRALCELGHEVGLLTGSTPLPEALEGLQLFTQGEFATSGSAESVPLSYWQERFRSYWGIDPSHIRQVAECASDHAADVVVAVGLDVLPYLSAVKRSKRVWYAADEWLWHHWSQVRVLDRRTWGHVKDGLLKAAYERAYSSMVDRAWVVSDADRRAMRCVAGMRGVDVVPNGVDTDYFTPCGEPTHDRTCVFWGRLDFGPNIQALQWFCRSVWPRLRRAEPSAAFHIYGFNPGAEMRGLVEQPGVSVHANLPDLRAHVAQHSVVVLPFRSGGGIKNKLLEAAAMEKAIVCSTRACNGLRHGGSTPFATASTPSRWASAIQRLWGDSEARRRLGEQARAWVVEHHTWEAAARGAVAGLQVVEKVPAS